MDGQEHRDEHREEHARNPNLRPPWKPGQSGNPGGRPKGRSLTSRLREKLDEIADESGRTYADLIVEGWIAAAQEGNVPAIKEVLDRTEGKVPDKVQLDDARKAYVTESPDTLWPSDPNSEPTSLTGPPDPSGETPAPSA